MNTINDDRPQDYLDHPIGQSSHISELRDIFSLILEKMLEVAEQPDADTFTTLKDRTLDFQEGGDGTTSDIVTIAHNDTQGIGFDQEKRLVIYRFYQRALDPEKTMYCCAERYTSTQMLACKSALIQTVPDLSMRQIVDGILQITNTLKMQREAKLLAKQEAIHNTATWVLNSLGVKV